MCNFTQFLLSSCLLNLDVKFIRLKFHGDTRKMFFGKFSSIEWGARAFTRRHRSSFFILLFAGLLNFTLKCLLISLSRLMILVFDELFSARYCLTELWKVTHCRELNFCVLFSASFFFAFLSPDRLWSTAVLCLFFFFQFKLNCKRRSGAIKARGERKFASLGPVRATQKRNFIAPIPSRKFQISRGHISLVPFSLSALLSFSVEGERRPGNLIWQQLNNFFFLLSFSLVKRNDDNEEN